MGVLESDFAELLRLVANSLFPKLPLLPCVCRLNIGKIFTFPPDHEEMDICSTFSLLFLHCRMHFGACILLFFFFSLHSCCYFAFRGHQMRSIPILCAQALLRLGSSMLCSSPFMPELFCVVLKPLPCR
jgi:hypothetical protein